MNNRLTPAEAKLRRMLDSGVNSLDPNTGATPSMTTGQDAMSTPLKGNFNVKVTKIYFTLNAGAYTKIADSALDADIQTALPVYLFGSTDALIGYKKFADLFPVNNSLWVFAGAGIYDGQNLKFNVLNQTTITAVTAELQKGDYVQFFTSTEPGTGTTTLCMIRQRCQEIPFGSLLLNVQGGDKLGIVKIRETMENTEAVYSAQNQNTLQLITQSILGKTTYDGLPVQSEVSGFQFNQNIVDININRMIDKYYGFQFEMEYTTPQITLTLMCGQLIKS